MAEQAPDAIEKGEQPPIVDDTPPNITDFALGLVEKYLPPAAGLGINAAANFCATPIDKFLDLTEDPDVAKGALSGVVRQAMKAYFVDGHARATRPKRPDAYAVPSRIVPLLAEVAPIPDNVRFLSDRRPSGPMPAA